MPRSSIWICSSWLAILVEVSKCSGIGALEVGLGLGELLLGRAFARHAADFRLDQLERLAGAVVAGLRAADEQRGAVERQEIRRDTVGQAALLAHFVVEPRGERAAAEDVVDHEGRDEVGILARDARRRRTTAPPAARRAATTMRRPTSCDARGRHGVSSAVRRQRAEHAIERRAERRGVDVADHRDLEGVAGEHARVHSRAGRRAVMVGTDSSVPLVGRP